MYKRQDKELTDEMKRFIHDLNEMYVSQPALSLMDNDYEGFEWIQLMKYEENVLTFLRKTENPEETLLAVCNFAAVPYENYQMGAVSYTHLAEQDLRDLMKIPDNYKVLFLQGGASQQFAMIPMNLMKNRVADYIVTGQWAKKAYRCV